MLDCIYPCINAVLHLNNIQGHANEEQKQGICCPAQCLADNTLVIKEIQSYSAKASNENQGSQAIFSAFAFYIATAFLLCILWSKLES